MKYCTWCGLEWETDEFHKSKAQKDGLHNHCKSCVKQRQAGRKKNTPDVIHRAHLKKHYGITLEHYRELEVQQDYRCGICKRTAEEAGDARRKRLCVDHDHVTGEIRGLLCGPCNSGLGHFYDNVATILAAADWLQKNGIRKPQQGAAK